MRNEHVYIGLVAGLLVGSFATVGALITAAHSDPGFAIEKDYYDRAVRFDEEIRRSRRTVDVAQTEGALVLTIDGPPVSALSVAAFPIARSGEITSPSAVALGDNRFRVVFEAARCGLWELDVTGDALYATARFERPCELELSAR